VEVALLVDAADRGRRDNRTAALMRGYGVASLVLIGLYPLLPPVWAHVELVAVLVGAATCVGYGRRAVIPERRRPWTLLVSAFAVLAAANLVRFMPGERANAIGDLVIAGGYVLLLAAGLAFIVRHGASDIGGVLDSVVIALAAGGVLWVTLSNWVGRDASIAAQIEIFAPFFALTGMFGALLRLAATSGEPAAALWWLLVGNGLAISGTVVLSLAGSSPAGYSSAVMLLLAASTAAGLFGLDPAGPGLVHPKAATTERLSTARLAFLGLAVALIPVVMGTSDLLTGDATGLVFAVPGVIAVLVMARIGLLSAQRARAEEGLAQQATHDPLTRLPNRRLFADRLSEELGRGARCAVLFCDLDGFKAINDRLGHDAGDALLVEVASRLQDCVGPDDVVSRIGGDEFVVLIVDPAPTRAEAVKSSIVEALRRPIERAGGLGIDVSIGVASADRERDPERLIQSADQAMYQVKAAHGGGRPPTHTSSSR
jgi:diguanylate cyclase (GGDEF)-like protein